jgi:hypothetical protein
MEIIYIGRRYENVWRANTTTKSLGAATYWKFNNKYLLTHEVSGVDTSLVFDSTRESQSGAPAITTHSGPDSIMWANLEDDLYYASQRGLILKARRNGDSSDYRDEAAPIVAKATGRPLHFGDPAIRKTVGLIISHLKVPDTGSIAIDVATRTDIGGNMEPADGISVAQVSGNLISTSYVTISNAPSQRRGVFFQVQWVSSRLDEEFELSMYSVEVAGLNTRNLTEAADTTS